MDKGLNTVHDKLRARLDLTCRDGEEIYTFEHEILWPRPTKICESVQECHVSTANERVRHFGVEC